MTSQDGVLVHSILPHPGVSNLFLVVLSETFSKDLIYDVKNINFCLYMFSLFLLSRRNSWPMRSVRAEGAKVLGSSLRHQLVSSEGRQRRTGAIQ